jgi:hypothetical protein
MRDGLLLFLLLVIVTVYGGCGYLGFGPDTSKFDRQVGKEIATRCARNVPCQIALKDATDFEWDEVYVFRIGLTPIDVDTCLGQKAGFTGEFTRKILFLRNGEIVGRDENFPDLERMLPGEVVFNVVNDGHARCQKYDKHAAFSVERMPTRGEEYYALTCANCSASPVVESVP